MEPPGTSWNLRQAPRTFGNRQEPLGTALLHLVTVDIKASGGLGAKKKEKNGGGRSERRRCRISRNFPNLGEPLGTSGNRQELPPVGLAGGADSAASAISSGSAPLEP